ncbi:MAG: MBL fold metallo-hydrolase [Methanothrix sp.]|nr:MBL fold metallo-hydrolase [Methanothrix sp.]MCX8207251.1 MBL fold metallo-hydrolase [Methanothrix sp.]
MLFERIVSEGLAHYSYILGNSGKAVVIDPRLDCDVYVDIASKNDMRITDILETHRNEDYVIGSVELSALTGASVWHADPELDYRYGAPARDGQVWQIGTWRIEAISAPGHTLGSMAYVLKDNAGVPHAVFTGDALFAGDVGRVDLLGMERSEELAGMLYESIFQRILPLGDGVLLCPAHGPGSVCGSAITDRPWTTIGMERLHNPKLRAGSRDEFIKSAAVELERPPYFRRMEELNVKGYRLRRHVVPALSPEEVADALDECVILDTRSEVAYGGAHIPASQFIWMDGLSALAGWYLSYDKPVILVGDEIDRATRILMRMGYDEISGYLGGGMLAWHMSGLESSSIRTVTVQELCRHLDQGGQAWILDVRSDEEVSRESITGAHHIHVTQLPGRIDEVPIEKAVYIFCGSGMRSMVAASFLKRHGWENLAVVLGGLAGWKSVTCPVVRLV